MTNPTTPSNPTSPTRPRASTETMTEHSDARWDDWQRRGTERDSTRSRGTWIIASVIGAGVIAWLIVTIG